MACSRPWLGARWQKAPLHSNNEQLPAALNEIELLAFFPLQYAVAFAATRAGDKRSELDTSAQGEGSLHG